MANKQFIVTQRGGAFKSIPLNAYPAEAWQQMMSAYATDDELMRRYDDTPWFRRAVDVRAETLANLPWAFVHDNGKELPEGELPPDLPFELDMDTFLNQIEAWLTLYGAAYVFKGLNAVKRIKELRLMHPSTITPQYDAAQGLTGYKRKLGAATLDLDPEDVCNIWLPPRKSETGPGTPPAKAALYAAMLLNTADEFGTIYFKNGVIAPTLIELPNETGDPDRDRIQDWLTRSATGIKKAFSALAIRQAIKVTQLGAQIPLGSLGLPELTMSKREDIATAFGVPQTLLFSNAANYATAQQDDLHFYDKTIIPEAKRIEQALNRHVFSLLGWTFQFKPERVEVYLRLEADKFNKFGDLYAAGLMTRDEARHEIGLDPLPDEMFKDTQRMNATANALAARPVTPPAPALPATVQQPAEVAAPKMLPDPISADLGRWQRKALKRVEEGKPEKAATFESDALPERLKAYIVGALDGATDAESVKQVFVLAEQWSTYP